MSVYGAHYSRKSAIGQIMPLSSPYTRPIHAEMLSIWQDHICDIAARAGALILEHYHNGTQHMTKDDGSPVTLADQMAEILITEALLQLTPDIPVIGEEASANQTTPPAPTSLFWLVDPLDGTKEFIRRNGEFTVNIALIADGAPILGVINAPALNECYSGIVGIGARMQCDRADWQQIACTPPDLKAGIRITASRSHNSPDQPSPIPHTIPIRGQTARGSSLKFCDVASGRADIYPRTGPTCEWDTAAGHAILMAAGGSMTRLDGSPFMYGKYQENFLNPGFVASSMPLAAHVGLLIRP